MQEDSFGAQKIIDFRNAKQEFKNISLLKTKKVNKADKLITHSHNQPENASNEDANEKDEQFSMQLCTLGSMEETG